MAEAPLIPQTPLQRQILQLALDLASQLEGHADQASPGHILDACESFLLDHGRQFLRDSLAATLQQHIAQAQKKGAPLAPAHADRPVATRATLPASSSLPWARSD